MAVHGKGSPLTFPQLLAGLLRAFPGARPLPVLHPNPAGPAFCRRCMYPTPFLDAADHPYHSECKDIAVGIIRL